MSQLDPKLAVPQPDSKLAASQPESELAASQPDSILTKSQPDSKLAASQPDSESVASQPVSELAAFQPDSKLAVTQPDCRLTPKAESRLTLTSVLSTRMKNSERICSLQSEKKMKYKSIVQELETTKELYEDGILILQDILPVTTEIQLALKKLLQGLRKHYDLQESLFQLNDEPDSKDSQQQRLQKQQLQHQKQQLQQQKQPNLSARTVPVNHERIEDSLDSTLEMDGEPVFASPAKVRQAETEDNPDNKETEEKFITRKRKILTPGSESQPQEILSDEEAFQEIKFESRKKYVRCFNEFRDFLGSQLEDRPPTEEEMLAFIKHLREEKERASSSLWTLYSMINSVCKIKYSLNMKVYTNVITLLRSYETDTKRKAGLFSTQEVLDFILEKYTTPYWLVRRIVVCLAYFGGLNSLEVASIQIENCVSIREGVHITYTKCGMKADKKIDTFLVPRNKVPKDKYKSCADIVDMYLALIKEKLNKTTGRLLWTGTAKTFSNQPMGKNMLSKIPMEMAKRLNLSSADQEGCYTFRSFRCSAAAALSGTNPEEMEDLFGWKKTKFACRLRGSSFIKMQTDEEMEEDLDDDTVWIKEEQPDEDEHHTDTFYYPDPMHQIDDPYADPTSQIKEEGVDPTNHSEDMGVYPTNHSEDMGVYPTNHSEDMGVYPTNHSEDMGVDPSNYSEHQTVFITDMKMES